ncbi:MAG: hypothetical protein OEV00_01460 [Acidobacteriota bacterium]|nr:hypothetical protein [Acidobacteriota bacterium]MDH3783974.1 hypothetical protein [Acidobacteriota bacterium]
MRSTVLIASAGVIVWRVVAWLLVFTQEGVSSGALLMQSLLATLGLAFLVCGWWVFSKIPGTAGLLFAGFCLCSGLHWGGPLELDGGSLRTALILFYILVSSILGATLLLQFALWFPRESTLARKRFVIGLLYAPLVLATLLAVGALIGGSADLVLLVHAVVSNLFSVVALGIIASHLFRSALTGAGKKYVGLMVLGMLLAWLPFLIASSIGVAADPWNLTVVALPITFAVAISAADRGLI